MSNQLNMSQELKNEFTFLEGKDNYNLVDGVYLPNNVNVPAQILEYAKGVAGNDKTVVVNVQQSTRLGISFNVSYIQWLPRNQWKRTDDAAIIYQVGEEVTHYFNLNNEIDNSIKNLVEVSLEYLTE